MFRFQFLFLIFGFVAYLYLILKRCLNLTIATIIREELRGEEVSRGMPYSQMLEMFMKIKFFIFIFVEYLYLILKACLNLP